MVALKQFFVLFILMFFIVMGYFTEKYSWAEESGKVLIHKKACDAGNIKECGDLAAIELDYDKTSANEHAKKACDGGGMRGCNVLGLLADKDGKRIEAIQLYKKACDFGEMRGCYNLGLLKEKESDKKEAKKLYQKACSSGLLLSCTSLAGILENDSPIEAKHLYAQVCEKGGTESCNNLGVLEIKAGNKFKAKSLFMKACAAGEMQSCDSLGGIEYDEKDKLDAEKAWKQACDGKITDACYNLGSLKKEQKNQTEAYFYFKQACDGGEQRACENLNDDAKKEKSQNEANLLSDPRLFTPFIVMILILGLVYLYHNSSRSEQICKDCGHSGSVIKTAKGSLLIEIILWCCFLVPGLIYSVWRLSNRVYYCPTCNGVNMIPLNSPIGARLARDQNKDSKIGQTSEN